VNTPAFRRLTFLMLALLGLAPLHAQREKLPMEDVEYVEKKWPEAKRTFTGLRYIILKPGDTKGAMPVNGNEVSVLYKGMLPDGTAYSASDPRTLAWVHVAEATSFLAAYLRHVRPDMRGTVPIKHLSRNIAGDHALFEDPQVEAPHVGCASTCGDLWRFAEMLRREGELDGARLLSPRMVRLARKIHTGDKPNELCKGVALRAGWAVPPANQGLGFQVRGTGVFQHLYGQLASPETFGNYGAGSALYWVDPALDVSFACLTAGVMTQAANIERFQKLSDIVVSACI